MPYECADCDAVFRKHDQLKIHNAEEHGGEHPHACVHQGCNKNFPSRSKLVAHSVVHSDKQKYSCGHSMCEFMTNKWSLLQSHVKNDHPPVCDECGKTFTRRDGLVHHFERTGHDGGAAASLLALKQKSDGDLCEESRFTRRVYKCDEPGCGRGFMRKYSLGIHVNTVHKFLRPHQCPNCDKTFAHKHLLTRHSRCHILVTAVVNDVDVNEVEGDEEEPVTPAESVDDDIAFLTGYSYDIYAKDVGRVHACPAEGCKERFLRRYDVERHHTSVHS